MPKNLRMCYICDRVFFENGITHEVIKGKTVCTQCCVMRGLGSYDESFQDQRFESREGDSQAVH